MINQQEYKTLCEEYGVSLTQEDITAVRRIADDGGEVRIWTSSSDHELDS